MCKKSRVSAGEIELGTIEPLWINSQELMGNPPQTQPFVCE